MHNKIIHIHASRNEDNLRIACHYEDTNFSGYEDKIISVKSINDRCKEIIKLAMKFSSRKQKTDEHVQGIMDYNNFEKLVNMGKDLCVSLFNKETIEFLIENKSSHHLKLFLDDGLVHIPWELIYFDNSFFCDKFYIGRNVNINKKYQALSQPKEREDILSQKMLIVVNPENNLPDAAKEGSIVLDIMDKLEDDNDSKYSIEATIVPEITCEMMLRDIHKYDFIHFAGHAEFNEEKPELSCWKLNDGKFYAKDIEKFRKYCAMPLVVFSNACQSARTDEWRLESGQTPHSFGLANAFLISGVKHYIGTFWEILDNPSTLFATVFYEALTQKLSIGEAMSKGRKALKEKYGENYIAWASYLLYGDPTTCYFNNKPDSNNTNLKDRLPKHNKTEDKSLIVNSSKNNDTKNINNETKKKSLKKIFKRSTSIKNNIKKFGLYPLTILSGFLIVFFLITYFNSYSSNSTQIKQQILNQSNEVINLLEKIKQIMPDSYKNLPQLWDGWTSPELTIVVNYIDCQSSRCSTKELKLFSVIQQRIVERSRFKCLERENYYVMLRNLYDQLNGVIDESTQIHKLYSPQFYLNIKTISSFFTTTVFIGLVDGKGQFCSLLSNRFCNFSSKYNDLLTILDKHLYMILEKNQLQGIISEVHKNEVVINIGELHGVDVGRIFSVLGTDVVLKIVLVERTTSTCEIAEGKKTLLSKGMKIRIRHKD